MKKLAFCTAIMNRLPQFAQVCEANLETMRQHPDCEWVILDYGSSDGLAQFLSHQRLTGNVRVFRAEAPRWHASIAKNLAIDCSEASIVMTLDADNRIGSAPSLVARMLPGEIIHHWSGRYLDGTFGRIMLARATFYDRLGGYDESFLPMAHQDSDLLQRARALGIAVRHVPCDANSAVGNTKANSVANCRGVSWREMKRSNAIRSRYHIASGQLRVARVASPPRCTPLRFG
jgi:hypothetical protein